MLERLQTTGKTLIANVRVADVRSGELSGEVNVLAENGVIADLNAGSAPGDCQVIDARGGTLMPGLIDCHAHILSPYLSEQKGIPGLWTLKQMPRNFEATLAAGTVCVRDMLSPIKVMNRSRRQIDSGEIPGPEIRASGAILSCKGGYPEFINPLPFPMSAIAGQPKINLTSPDHARSIIPALHKYGINVVKVGFASYTHDFDTARRVPTIDNDTLDAICETAHSLGLKVAVHHNWSDDLSRLLESNIDSLEHIISDREFTDEEIETIKSKGIASVPTLTAAESIARFHEKSEFLNGNRADDYFEPQAIEHLRLLASLWTDTAPQSWHKNFGRFRNNYSQIGMMKTNLRKLYKAGVKICAGTDMGAVVIFPGEMIDEVIRMHSVGLSRLHAIQAATINAAELVGLPDALGAVEPGKRADVYVIEGNPFEDLEALRKVRYVGKGGAWYRALRESVPQFWNGNQITRPE